MWGPITDVASGIVEAIAGGHREGTHDLILAPVAVLALFSGLAWLAGVWAQLLLIAMAIGLMLKGLSLLDLGRVGAVSNLMLSWGGAWWIVDSGHAAGLRSIAVAAAAGVIAHALGDLATRDGVPVPLARLVGSGARWRA